MTGQDSNNDNSNTMMPSYDLIPLISPHLDLHMIFPLLEFQESCILNNNNDTTSSSPTYSSASVVAARLALIRNTHMVDYAIEIHHEVHKEGEKEVPEEFEEWRQNVYGELNRLREGAVKCDELFRNDELKANLQANNNWNIKFITSEPGLEITPESLSLYYKFAKFNFDCGDYAQANDMIDNYMSLFTNPPKPVLENDGEGGDDDEGNGGDNNNKEDGTAANSSEKLGNPDMYYLTSIDTSLLQVLWGKLSVTILMESWEEAGVALSAVKTAIESLASSNKLSALEALHQRTWLLHWSLFVFWNDPTGKGPESMVELFTSEKYLQAMTTHAPHLLRYFTAAVLLCKRRAAKKSSAGGSNAESRKLLRDLVKVMQQCEYSDPIVEFVDKLSVQFDFDGAQSQLEKCEAVLSGDFWLCKQCDMFMEEARNFVFENYCRIHHKVALKTLGEKLAMSPEKAERWIVDLIRNAMLDAKIDSEEGCVVMGAGTVSVYEQVMDKTRDLTARSAGLTSNLRGYLNDVRRAKIAREKKAREELEGY